MMLDEVREQPEAVLFLRRVVDRTLSSPLLLIGDDGVGRRLSVTQTAKTIFCTGIRNKDCECLHCVQIRAKVHPDLTYITPEEDKDIGVEIARDLSRAVLTYPTVGPLRIVMIDGADRMTVPAANALLKVLEEPPAHVRFFLLAESYLRVIPTIRSRCGRVSYRSLPEAFIVSELQRFEDDRTKALVYARLSEGSVGRALRFWGSGKLEFRNKTFSLLGYATNKDLPGLFASLDMLDKELGLCLSFLDHLLHDILMVRVDPTRMINGDIFSEIDAVSQRISPASCRRMIEGIRSIRGVSRNSGVAQLFHVKSLFAQTFVG